MRVVHCISSLAGGGAERQLSYLAPELVRMGIDVHVAYLRGGPYLNTLQEHGVKLHHIASKNNHDPSIFIGLMNLFKNVPPDVIQTWIVQMDILGALASKLCGIPCVLRESSQRDAYIPCMKTYLREIAARYVSAIVSNSVGGDAYWVSRKLKTQRYVIPNGLPMNDILRAPDFDLAKLGFDSDERLLVYAGRLLPTKNVSNLLEACCIAMENERFVVAICGDGSQRLLLEEKVKALGLADRVAFVGFTQSVWSFLKRANVFAFVSGHEGFPNALVEAMICGAPLVISDISAHREIADERTAVFVDGTDVQSIANGILKVLKDEMQASNRSKLAQQNAAKWSVEAMASKYVEVYQNVTCDRSSG